MVVLDATSKVWLIRQAAHNVVLREEREAREKAAQAAKARKK